MRFVLLQHELPKNATRASHVDLMLERKEGLATWAVTEWPPRTEGCSGKRLPVHRKAYLDYEGAVSGDRGEVTRMDRGVYTVRKWSDEKIEVVITGSTHAGVVTLLPKENDLWHVTFHAPAFGVS